MNLAQRRTLWAAVLTLAFSIAALLAGCNTTTGSFVSKGFAGSLPNPPAPTQVNDYTGTATPGDIWTVHIDHTGNTFSAQDKTAGTPTVNGTFVNAGGFLKFSVNAVPSGYALEILSRAVLARPGDDTNDLIALIQTPTGTCLNISGTVGFEFVTVPSSSWAVGSDVAFGSVQASTNGNIWNFSSLTQATLGGTPKDVGAALSPGNCSNSVITIPPSPTIQNTVTVGVGPSGIFAADEGPGGQGEAGVIEPSGPLNTGSVVAGNYLGFLYEPGAAARSQMAGFGGGAGTSMTGGTFPNDDPTQAHATNMTINLGTQDSVSNGLYKAASVTIGANPSFPAVAVVGNPENKFVIFLLAQDTVNNHPMAIYLFQQ
ncbi:MAG: hypothetical protein LAN37_01930 [Acidobacteriia bacterium]|nr:hypothetical protein [Terriglobia bacterium]